MNFYLVYSLDTPDKNRIKRFVFRFLYKDLINTLGNTIKKIISDNISTAVHAILDDKHLLEVIGAYLTVGLRANMAQQWRAQTFFISYNKRYKKTKPWIANTFHLSFLRLSKIN